MSHTTVSARIRDFLLQRFPAARTRGLGDRDHLLENGILDSLGVLDVVAFLEEAYGISVLDDDLVPEHFQSVEQLTAFVQAKRNGQ